MSVTVTVCELVSPLILPELNDRPVLARKSGSSDNMADRHSKNIENVEKKVTETVLTRGTLASRMINPELFVRPVSQTNRIIALK